MGAKQRIEDRGLRIQGRKRQPGRCGRRGWRPVGQIGEVLGADGAGSEMVGENLADVGEVVEPRQDLGGGLAVGEAAVELVAEGLREAGDFSGAHMF